VSSINGQYQSVMTSTSGRISIRGEYQWPAPVSDGQYQWAETASDSISGQYQENNGQYQKPVSISIASIHDQY
jgi:hypothetical protein